MPNGDVKFSELEKRCEALYKASERYKTEAQEKFRYYDKITDGILGSKEALNDSIKTQGGQLKLIFARVEALAKEVESQKKSAAGMADINAVKKLIADLTKRIEVLERKK
jgi:hypothetical protein